MEYDCRDFCEIEPRIHHNGHFDYTAELDMYGHYGITDYGMTMGIYSFSNESIEEWGQFLRERSANDEEMGDASGVSLPLIEMKKVIQDGDINKTYELLDEYERIDKFTLVEIGGQRALYQRPPSAKAVSAHSYYIPISDTRWIYVSGYISRFEENKPEYGKERVEEIIKRISI